MRNITCLLIVFSSGCASESGSSGSTTDTLSDTPSGASMTTCGSMACAAATEDCFYSCGPRSIGACCNAACVTKGSCGGKSETFSCSGAKSCAAGEVCCHTADGAGSKCVTSCSQMTLCEFDTDCPPGQWCHAAVTGYFRKCVPRGDAG